MVYRNIPLNGFQTSFMKGEDNIHCLGSNFVGMLLYMSAPYRDFAASLSEEEQVVLYCT